MSNSNLKITALSVADLATLLRRSGSRTISEDAIRRDIEKGAPVNSDGTVNLLNYTAWLVKESADYVDGTI